MRSRLLRGDAIGLYLLVVLLIVGGLAASPLNTARTTNSGSGFVTVDLATSSQTYEFSLSTSVALGSPGSQAPARAQTPTETVVTVALAPVSPPHFNFSSTFSIKEAYVVVDDATTLSSSSTNDSVSLPLDLTSQSSGGSYGGSASGVLEYLKPMAWTGTVHLTLELANGTEVSRHVAVAPAGMSILPGTGITTVLVDWALTIFFWVSAAAALGLGIYLMKNPRNRLSKRG